MGGDPAAIVRPRRRRRLQPAGGISDLLFVPYARGDITSKGSTGGQPAAEREIRPRQAHMHGQDAYGRGDAPGLRQGSRGLRMGKPRSRHVPGLRSRQVGHVTRGVSTGRPQDPCCDTPWGYIRIALQGRDGRCYPLLTFGAGNAGGALGNPSETTLKRVDPGAAQATSRDSPVRHGSSDPLGDAIIHRHHLHRRIRSNEWT